MNDNQWSTTYLDNIVLRKHSDILFDIASGDSNLTTKDINKILNQMAIELQLMAEEFETAMELDNE